MKKKLVKPKYNTAQEKTREIKSFQKSTFDEKKICFQIKKPQILKKI